VRPLPVSVLGVCIWASRARLHKAMTLCIISTQASGRKHLAPCRTPLRKGQNPEQNPPLLTILVDPLCLFTMHTLTGISPCNSKEEYPIDNRNT